MISINCVLFNVLIVRDFESSKFCQKKGDTKIDTCKIEALGETFFPVDGYSEKKILRACDAL